VLKRLIASAALAGGLLVAPVAASAPAFAAVHASVAASCYKRVGDHWNCITPGAFCPKAAHGKIGYAKATSKRYRCTYKNSDPYWRWRRA